MSNRMMKARRQLLKRFFLISAIIVFCLGAIVGTGLSAMNWRFKTKLPNSNFAQPRDLAEARMQDLNYLRKLPQTDYSFSPEELTNFNELIDELQSKAASMSIAEFTMGVAAAVAISDNAHTNVRLFQSVDGFNSLPVRFFWFADGLYVVRARPSHAHLLGARLTSYDGTAPENLVTKLKPYIGGNDHYLRYHSPIFLASPAAMHTAGLAKSPDQVTLELQLTEHSASNVVINSEERTTPISRVHGHPLSINSQQEMDSGNAWQYLESSVTSASYFGRNPDLILWSEELPNNGYYLRLRLITDDGERELKSWLKELSDRYSTTPLEYLVVDVRSTNGGDYMKTKNFAGRVSDILTPDGRVYLLTDEGTFSAAIVTVAYAVESAGAYAIIVGAPMGDDEQFWAESSGRFTLPNSGIEIWIATGYHDWENGCNNWIDCFWLNIIYGVAAGPLEPHILAPLSFADYSRGIDTTMQAVFVAQREYVQR